MVVSRLQSRFVHVPLELVTSKRKMLNIESDYWRAVIESTGQEDFGAHAAQYCDKPPA